MSKGFNHIISRFSWNTSFDQTEKAIELQSRLSSWSRVNMQKEIAEVLDRVCPPDQFWKIETLTLDLGRVDLNELESQLAIKLCSKLHEKLSNLILYAKDNKLTNIEILDKDLSHIDLLSSFLLHGVMPWNYKTTDGSINEMLAGQLKNNQQNVIAMLRSAALSHLNVRRRIAWQVSEKNITRIIEIIEPGNSRKIIDFSKTIVNIQIKETIVQSNTVDFKKNLWFWVLNYFLADHGSAFNKLSFLKSSIRQMADHYNTSYNEILELLERAIEKIDRTDRLHDDFLHTIKILTKEKGIAKAENDLEINDTDGAWVLLEKHFLGILSNRRIASIHEFNELIISLSQLDEKRFYNLIFSLKNSGRGWVYVTDHLNKEALEIILRALDPAGYNMLIQRIHFIDKLCSGTGLQVKRNVFLEIGINYLLCHNDMPFNARDFFRYCGANPVSSNKTIGAAIIECLISNGIPGTLKTISSSEIYQELMPALVESKTVSQTDYYKNLFNDLINGLSSGIPPEGEEGFIALQKQFIRGMQVDPATSLKILQEYRDKDLLQKVIPYILDENTAMMLLQHSKNEKYALVVHAGKIITELKAEGNAGALIAIIGSNLYSTALQQILLDPEISQSKLLELLLSKLYRMIPVSMQQQFNLFVYKLFAGKKLYAYGISAMGHEKILSTYCADEKPFVLDRVIKMINTLPGKQAETGDLLTACFEDNEFVRLRRTEVTANNTILNYFLNDGYGLAQYLIEKYVLLLSDQLKGLSKIELRYRISELFWKCILRYNEYDGKKAILENIFQKAIVMNFKLPVALQRVDTAEQSTPKFNDESNALNKANHISEGAFILIEQCLETGLSSITSNGRTFNLKALMEKAMDADPSMMKVILNKIPVTQQRIELIRSAVNFCELSSWVMYDIQEESKVTIETIRFLYDTACKITGAKNMEILEKQYWKVLWTNINTNALPDGGAKKIVADCLYFLKETTGKNAAGILQAMEKYDTWLTPSVKNILQQNMVTGSALTVHEIIDLPEGKLLRSERMGLLAALCNSLINEMKVPVWFDDHTDGQDVKSLTNEVLHHYPVDFFIVLKKHSITTAQMQRLSNVFDFKVLTTAIGKLNNDRKPLLDTLCALHNVFEKINMQGISPKQLQDTLIIKILRAWTTGNWKSIQAENIFNEILWDMMTKYGLLKKQFIPAIDKHKAYLPGPLQIAFEQIKNSGQHIKSRDGNLIAIKPVKQVLQKQVPEASYKHGIAVKNAGMVMINSYIMLLFERLGIIINNKFLSDTARSEGVHFLQYAVTGLRNTDESFLPLNKVLCGVPLEQPVPEGIEVSDDNRQLIEGLIKAIIGYWPSIGETSVDGFRGNWLVRNGVLKELEDKWELAVEKRPYDILMQRSPFSFSVIKYPWMSKPLHVYWQY